MDSHRCEGQSSLMRSSGYILNAQVRELIRTKMLFILALITLWSVGEFMSSSCWAFLVRLSQSCILDNGSKEDYQRDFWSYWWRMSSKDEWLVREEYGPRGERNPNQIGNPSDSDISCFLLTKKIFSKLSWCMARYWSSSLDKRSLHWLAWNKLIVPKCKGGMGSRHLNSLTWHC